MLRSGCLLLARSPSRVGKRRSSTRSVASETAAHSLPRRIGRYLLTTPCFAGYTKPQLHEFIEASIKCSNRSRALLFLRHLQHRRQSLIVSERAAVSTYFRVGGTKAEVDQAVQSLQDAPVTAVVKGKGRGRGRGRLSSSRVKAPLTIVERQKKSLLASIRAFRALRTIAVVRGGRSTIYKLLERDVNERWWADELRSLDQLTDSSGAPFTPSELVAVKVYTVWRHLRSFNDGHLAFHTPIEESFVKECGQRWKRMSPIDKNCYRTNTLRESYMARRLITDRALCATVTASLKGDYVLRTPLPLSNSGIRSRQVEAEAASQKKVRAMLDAQANNERIDRELVKADSQMHDSAASTSVASSSTGSSAATNDTMRKRPVGGPCVTAWLLFGDALYEPLPGRPARDPQTNMIKEVLFWRQAEPWLKRINILEAIDFIQHCDSAGSQLNLPSLRAQIQSVAAARRAAEKEMRLKREKARALQASKKFGARSPASYCIDRFVEGSLDKTIDAVIRQLDHAMSDDSATLRAEDDTNAAAAGGDDEDASGQLSTSDDELPTSRSALTDFDLIDKMCDEWREKKVFAGM